MKPLLLLPLWKQLVVLLPLGAVLLAAAWTDFKSRKVYNKLTYPAIVVGIIAHSIAFGLDGLKAALFGAGISFIVGLFVLPFGWIKAGDIKLLIAVAAFLGLAGMGEVFFYAVLFGGVFGIVRSLFNGYIVELFRRLGHLIRGYFRALAYSTPHLATKLEHDERSWIPFAIAIFFGGICVFLEYALDFVGPLTYAVRVLSAS
jgi:prepilin peptidase CpaA